MRKFLDNIIDICNLFFMHFKINYDHIITTKQSIKLVKFNLVLHITYVLYCVMEAFKTIIKKYNCISDVLYIKR